MVSIVYDEVLTLVEQLTPEELQALAAHLETITRLIKPDVAEFAQQLNAVAIDLGPLPEDWSDRREDWYGDNGR